MDCPICHKVGLDQETALCPQCDSDLSCFPLLDSMAAGQQMLKQRLAENDTAIKRHRAGKHMALALCGALACLCLVLAGLFYAVRANNQAELGSLQSEILSLRDSLMKDIPQTGTETVSRPPFRYVIQKGDNLAKITRIFYGEATCCDSLRVNNDLRDDGLIFAGDTLLIKL
jgi:hypothetical protein